MNEPDPMKITLSTERYAWTFRGFSHTGRIVRPQAPFTEPSSEESINHFVLMKTDRGELVMAPAGLMRPADETKIPWIEAGPQYHLDTAEHWLESCEQAEGKRPLAFGFKQIRRSIQLVRLCLGLSSSPAPATDFEPIQARDWTFEIVKPDPDGVYTLHPLTLTAEQYRSLTNQAKGARRGIADYIRLCLHFTPAE